MSIDARELATMLGDSIDRYVHQAYTFEQRSAWLRSPIRHSASAWASYADFGWLALRGPEDGGGASADLSSLCVLMERVGAHLLLEPLFASTVLGTGMIMRAANPAQQSSWLPSLADGSLKLAFAHEDTSPPQTCRLDAAGRLSGSKTNVLHGDVADRLILSCERDGHAVLCIADVNTQSVCRRDYALVDGRGACQLEFDRVSVEILNEGQRAEETLAEALDEASILLCAEAVGVIRSLNRKTAQYLSVRKQFGRPIGTNQALQHRLTEMYLLQQECVALTDLAVQSFTRNADSRERDVSGTRAYVARALRHIANEAVQMHGGIGITDELDISHYFRRAMVVNGLFGSRDQHFERFLATCVEPAQ